MAAENMKPNQTEPLRASEDVRAPMRTSERLVGTGKNRSPEEPLRAVEI